MRAPEDVRKLVLDIVTQITSYQDDLRVKLSESSGALPTITVTAHPADCRRLVGREGRNFGALAMVVEMSGRWIGKRMRIAPIHRSRNDGDRMALSPFKENSKWDRVMFIEMAKRIFTPFKMNDLFLIEENGTTASLIVNAKMTRPEANVCCATMSSLISTIGSSLGADIDLSIREYNS